MHILLYVIFYILCFISYFLFILFYAYFPCVVFYNICTVHGADLTHKSGNQLDLICTRYCSTDNTLVTPLHTSDHFLITSNLTLTPDIAHAPPQVTFRRNLRSLSPSRLSSMVSSTLPSPSQFSALDTNSATDTLLHSNILLRQLLPPFIQTSTHYPLCPLVVRCSP